jgi:hypothetical protein
LCSQLRSLCALLFKSVFILLRDLRASVVNPSDIED